MEAKEEVLQLTKTLNEANYRYYVLDDPTMPDFEYDRLLRRLEELEAAHPELLAPDSPTQRVGGSALSQFEKVEHEVPLESLQDVFSLEELAEFTERVRQAVPAPVYTVEPKEKYVQGANASPGGAISSSSPGRHQAPTRLRADAASVSSKARRGPLHPSAKRG